MNRDMMQLLDIYGEGPFALNNTAMIAGSAHLYDKKFLNIYQNVPFDPSKELLDEEVSGFLVRSSFGDSRELSYNFSRPPNLVGVLSGIVMPINLQHSHNYFHFLIDSLPSLLNSFKFDIVKKSNVTLVSGRLHPNYKFILNKLFKASFNLLELKQFNYVEGFFIYPKPSYIAHELIDKKMPECKYVASYITYARKVLHESFRDLFVPSTKNKIFVVRKSFQRNIINIEEVVDEAIKAGYTIVVPERLSIPDQIKIFNSATTVIGPTGAWLANLIFLNEGSKVFVLHPRTTYSKLSIWEKLGRIFDLDVSDHYFDIATLNEYQPIHSDFIVDLDYLRSIF